MNDPVPLPSDSTDHSISVLALTAPVAMGYIPLGMVFGFLFVQAGAAWWLAVLASIFVFAGAAQYMMIPMLAAGMSIGTIAFATLIVNLRHVFYGLSLLNRLPQGKLLRWYLVFGLTDETYSVITTMPEGSSHKRMVLVTFLNQTWWVLGSVIGAVIGERAQVTLVGLDFALVALFCVLTVEQWRSRKNAKPLWVASVAYAVAYLISAQHALLLAIALSVAVAVAMQTKQDGSTRERRSG